jgi:hypothetical protein
MTTEEAIATIKTEAGTPRVNRPKLSPNTSRLARDGVANGLLEDALFNDTDPYIFFDREKPVHRRMAEMSAQGFNVKEIAEYTHYESHYVSQVLKQPYARQYMIRSVKQSAQQEMKEFLEAELMPSLKTVKDVRDDLNARQSDRLSASRELLDRLLGRSAQPILQSDVAAEKLSNEELERRVQQLCAAGIPTPEANPA